MNQTQQTPYNSYPNIIQDFVDMQECYSPLYTDEKDYPSVKAWLKQIRTEGFTNPMMDEILRYIYKLLQKEQREEATLLLLISSATEHDEANYILARELYKGELFEANKAAAFGIFSTLSSRGHPQALCDMGYFYKNGIMVKKDKQQAVNFYRLAMEAGVERAKKQYLLLTQKHFRF